MTLQQAFQAWMDTQRLVLDMHHGLTERRLRIQAWETYCAIRDGKEVKSGTVSSIKPMTELRRRLYLS